LTLQHFPVKRSTLDENAVAEWALSCYPLREPVRCRFLRKSMSDVYLMYTRDAAYILKVYMHNRHSRHELEAEVGLLNDLLDQDIPVAAPIANNDAAYLNEIDAPEGTRYAVLFDAITGDEPQETNLSHSRSFGQLAGRMHNCADRLAKKYDRWHLDEKYLVEEPLNRIRPYLQNRERDLEYLSVLGGELIAKPTNTDWVLRWKAALPGRTTVHRWVTEDEKGRFGGLGQIAKAGIPKEPGSQGGS